MESFWSKQQIIEAYLNLVSYRGELQGVAAMSRQLFGKWPHGLDERESALAAALLRSPNAAPALVVKRACNLLKEMDRASECEGLEGFAGQALSGGLRENEQNRERNSNEQFAPHLARKLLTQAGQQLRSSLNADLQRFASEALRRHLAALRLHNVEEFEDNGGNATEMAGTEFAFKLVLDVRGIDLIALRLGVEIVFARCKQHINTCGP